MAEMTERVRASEQRLAENAGAVEEAERRALDAEERASELETRLAEQQLATETREGIEGDKQLQTDQRVAELESELRDSRESLTLTEASARQVETEFRELHCSSKAEKEAVLQQAELSHYRAVEEERRKWEVRKKRLFDSLAGLEEELRTATAVGRRTQSDDAAALAAQLEAAEEQVRAKTSHLQSSEVLRQELARERDALRRENQELREQQAEMAWWRSTETQLGTLGAGQERPSTLPRTCPVSGGFGMAGGRL